MCDSVGVALQRVMRTEAGSAMLQLLRVPQGEEDDCGKMEHQKSAMASGNRLQRWGWKKRLFLEMMCFVGHRSSVGAGGSE